jgi:hypothetical protein
MISQSLRVSCLTLASKKTETTISLALNLWRFLSLTQEYEKKQHDQAPAGLVTERNREEIGSEDSADMNIGDHAEVPLPKNSQKLIHKKQMKTYSRNIKTILNILWICLDNSTYEFLQTNEKLLVQLSIYMATDMSVKNREKESLVVNSLDQKLSRFSSWNSKRDEFIQKIDNITDNVNAPKPQFEQDKMLFGKDALSPLLIGSNSRTRNINSEYPNSDARFSENIAEKLIDVKKLLVSEEDAIFNLIDIFSELNEKRTEFMRVNINDFFGDSFIADIRRNISPPITPMNNRGDLRSKGFSENSEYQFIPSLRGTPIINFIPSSYYFARTNTCPLLKKLGVSLEILLAHCPLSSPHFWPLLASNLATLDGFMASTSSRVVVFEVIEKLLPTLVCLKSVFLRLADVDVKEYPPKQMSQRASPRNPYRESKEQKMKNAAQLRREDSYGYQIPGQTQR